MSTTYTPRPGSLAAHVVAFFRANPDEQLTSRDIGEKFDVHMYGVNTQLRAAVDHGLLSVVPGSGTQPSTYSAAPGNAAPPAAAWPAAAPAAPSPEPAAPAEAPALAGDARRYRQLFQDACTALGTISERLGLPDGEGGPPAVLAAIDALKQRAEGAALARTATVEACATGTPPSITVHVHLHGPRA